MPKVAMPKWGMILLFSILLSLSLYWVLQAQQRVTSAPVQMSLPSSPIPIQHWKIPDGPRIYLVQRSEQPIVDLIIGFDAGSARDTIPGTAYITAHLIEKGCRNANAIDIAETFESVGAQFSVDVNPDNAQFSLRTLSDRAALTQTFEMLEEMLTYPVFPEKAFETSVAKAQAAYLSEQKLPAAVAQTAFIKSLYGEHPYANRIKGTPDTLSTLTLEAVKAFYKKHYTAENMVIVAVGDITPGMLDDWAQQWSEALSVGDPLAPIKAVEMPVTAQAKAIDFKSEQTHIYFGLPVEQAIDNDEFSLKIGREILGGAFLSRLYQKVRDEQGLAYHVSARSSPRQQAGPFYVTLQTRTEKAAQATQMVRDIVRDFIATGPTNEEVIAAKQTLQSELALMFASNAWTAAHLFELGFYDLPLDYFDRYAENLSSVTPEQVKAVFQKRAPFEHWQQLTLGQHSE